MKEKSFFESGLYVKDVLLDKCGLQKLSPSFIVLKLTSENDFFFKFYRLSGRQNITLLYLVLNLL